jgi:hypothetical protein
MKYLAFDHPVFDKCIVLHDAFLELPLQKIMKLRRFDVLARSDIFIENGDFVGENIPKNSMKFKYICYGIPESFVLFNIWHDHMNMANDLNLPDIHSAGFCDQTVDGLVCHGHSVGLQISSREQDTDIVNQLFAIPTI